MTDTHGTDGPGPDDPGTDGPETGGPGIDDPETDGSTADEPSTSRQAHLRTTHGRHAATVAAALRPDNTDSMTTRVDGDAVVTTVGRDSTGGLQSTVDDYVVNLTVADAVVAAARGPTGSTDIEDGHSGDEDGETSGSGSGPGADDGSTVDTQRRERPRRRQQPTHSDSSDDSDNTDNSDSSDTDTDTTNE